MSSTDSASALIGSSSTPAVTSSTSTSSSTTTPTTTSTTPTSTSSTTSRTSTTSDTTSSAFTTTSPSSTSTSTRTTTRPSTTTTVSSSTIAPQTTVVTSTITSASSDGTTAAPQTTTVVITSSGTTVEKTYTSTIPSNTSTSSTSPSQISNGGHNSSSGGSGGLSTGATTAIAVVIPVIAVAALLGLAICFWRRRKQKKNAAEERRKEVEDYGFNPNQDPHLPVVGADGTQMTEDTSGYRGWGTTTASNRKASTALSGGHTQQLSDADNSYLGHSSPETRCADGMVAGEGLANGAANHHQRNTFNSDELSALPVARSHSQHNGLNSSNNNVAIKRGPSNASSAYSAGGRSDHSDEPPMPNRGGQGYDYTPTQGYGYSQHGPYGDGTYGGGQDPSNMPIIQDVSARRNTRIQPAGSYQQGNSGIAQNF